MSDLTCIVSLLREAAKWIYLFLHVEQKFNQKDLAGATCMRCFTYCNQVSGYAL